MATFSCETVEYANLEKHMDTLKCSVIQYHIMKILTMTNVCQILHQWSIENDNSNMVRYESIHMVNCKELSKNVGIDIRYLNAELDHIKCSQKPVVVFIFSTIRFVIAYTEALNLLDMMIAFVSSKLTDDYILYNGVHHMHIWSKFMNGRINGMRKNMSNTRADKKLHRLWKQFCTNCFSLYNTLKFDKNEREIIYAIGTKLETKELFKSEFDEVLRILDLISADDSSLKINV